MTTEAQESRAGMPDSRPEGSGRNPPGAGWWSAKCHGKERDFCTGTDNMMEAVVERENMRRAYRRVVSNKGAPGVDGMFTEELHGYLQENWACTLNGLDLCHCLIMLSCFKVIHEPPYTEPYVRWCGRTEGVTPPPT